MPTFDFHCPACEHTFEQTIPFGSKDFPPCPECDGPTEKLIAPPTIHFKGEGFYKTDSTTKKEAPKKAPTEAKMAEKPAKKPSKPTDQKTSKKDSK